MPPQTAKGHPVRRLIDLILLPFTSGATLDRALTNGNVEGVRRALEAGVDPNASDHLSGLSALVQAAEACQLSLRSEGPERSEIEDRVIQILKLLFDHGAKLGPDDRPILRGPAMYGATRVMAFLLARGADVNGTAGDGMTPMRLAIKYDYPKIVTLLQAHGVDLLPANEIAQQKFVRAAWVGDVTKMKRWATKGAKINGRSWDERTALTTAAREQRVEAVAWLLEQGASPDRVGRIIVLASPLWHSVSIRERSFPPEVAEMLLAAGARVSATDATFKQTPLHLAALVDNAIAVRLLLDHGAKVMLLDAEGKTPLDHAKGGEVIRMLKEAGAVER